ncbi:MULTISPECIES: chloride channel protein [unclassified Rhizobium]|jgi:CIC family chloride channel protein|uniref:chloride channel protein n=1 Tax=unclassified Rhizobium TaxID=2613769 RepID=UPI00036213C2|nr:MULTISPECIES: chloride channel protein [unclassified Rhizobium]MBO9124613.1 chloride channel protein [Rhizobium sp. 16-488-2b]MBO9175197.1 chloride channel protein [Rhizobium sp. 16-488-2a]MBO9194554.1 chloride channel protein [Rhizobium sp. 16-449-1b]
MRLKINLRRLGPLHTLLDAGRMRALLRRSEMGMVLAGALIGVTSGLAVTGMSLISREMHSLIFGISDVERLSSSQIDDKFLLMAAPVCGGILLGLLMYVLAKTRKKPMVDPIEANALHGGRLSLTDSIIVAIQNLISNGFGASVGLEAGYTQLASGIASKLGFKLQLRRADLRVLVGCGAAGAIAAAFNAPLTGAFYAFELIIGTYTIVSLTPVVVSALVSTLVARLLAGSDFIIDVGDFGTVMPADYVPAILLGAFCAGIGILIMQGVAFIEELARRSSIALPFRPALGGIIVGLLALVTPQVLSAGHGALHLNLDREVVIPVLIGLFLLKALASAISIGSGFRGGLFFASLFMGALLGKFFAYSAPYFAHATLTPIIYAVVGMSSLAVAVIGGPLTMTFLALEITGDFPITALVLAAVITSSLVVRSTFGYSFATWRFHLRGESIRSAHDVGWIRNLTVNKLMRADVKTAKVGISIEQFKESFPIGSAQRVILVEDSGKYAGLVLVPDIYANLTDTADESKGLDEFVRYRNDFLTPQMNAKQAAAIFDKTESEALAVVNNLVERTVVGQLSEAHTLRRYSEELDRRRREVSGEI